MQAKTIWQQGSDNPENGLPSLKNNYRGDSKFRKITVFSSTLPWQD
jgi:hypothetical protein